MTQDAYSPLTGRWGVEGFWDLVFLGLAVTAVAFLVFVLTDSRRERAFAGIAAAALVPTYFGVGWLDSVRVDAPGTGNAYCALAGRVDSSSACGGEYLARYFAVAVPLTLLLVLLLALLLVHARHRLRSRPLVAT